MMPLLSTLFIFITLESASQASVILPITIPITNQSFRMTYTCPPGSYCIFECTSHFASCLETHFSCLDSTCAVNCRTECACIYASLQCNSSAGRLPPWPCALNCIAPGSCSFFAVNKDASPFPINASATSGLSSSPGTLSTTVGTLLAKSFALLNQTLNNYLLTDDFTLQMLSLSLPGDGESFSRLLVDLKGMLHGVIVESDIESWQDYPDFVLVKENEYFIEGKADSGEAIRWSFQNYVDNFNVPGLKIKKVEVLSGNDSAVLLFAYAPYSLVSYFGILGYYVSPYFETLFRFPNSSFVDVHFSSINTTDFIVHVNFYPMHCKKPVPFWGSYCLDHTWYSEGELSLAFDDFIGSEATHVGSLMVDSKSLLMVGGSLTTDNLIISSGSLRIANSSINAGKIELTSTTLEVKAAFVSISSEAVVIGEGSRLVVSLEEEEWGRYEREGTISVAALQADTMFGNFSEIMFVSSKGNIQGCTSTHYQNNTLFVTLLLGCDEGHVITPSLLGGVVGGVLGATVLLSAIIAIFYAQKNKVLIQQIRDRLQTPTP